MPHGPRDRLNRSELTFVLPYLPLHRYVWPRNWGPSYAHSYAICISTNGLCIIMCYLFRPHLAYLNRRLDEEEEEKGVKEKGFRYLL